MIRKKKGLESLVMVPELFTAEVDSRVVMVDPKDVRGVAYSPKYRAWRAYLHKGSKQVHHSLHGSKEAAVKARRAAEVQFGDTVIPEELRDKPGMFRRFNRAPKNTDRFGAVTSVGGVASIIRSDVKKASETWAGRADRRRSPLLRVDEKKLGRNIGMMLALVEYLVMTGDLRVSDIKAGLESQSQVLGHVNVESSFRDRIKAALLKEEY